jgi:hypothetical protein
MKLASAFLKLAATLWALAVVCPIRYVHLSTGLDASFVYALNEASRQGLMPGRDYVFTYGPLSWLIWPMGHQLGRGLVWQGVFWLLFAIVWLWGTWRAPVANVVIASLCVYAGTRPMEGLLTGFDTFLEILVLLTLACAVERTRMRWAFFGLAVGVGVLLCFVKLTAAIFAAGAVLSWSIGMYGVDRRIAVQSAAWGVRGFLAGFVCLFLVMAPSWSALGAYLRGSLDLSAGYSVAMSFAEDPGDSPGVCAVSGVGRRVVVPPGRISGNGRHCNCAVIPRLQAIHCTARRAY